MCNLVAHLRNLVQCLSASTRSPISCIVQIYFSWTKKYELTIHMAFVAKICKDIICKLLEILFCLQRQDPLQFVRIWHEAIEYLRKTLMSSAIVLYSIMLNCQIDDDNQVIMNMIQDLPCNVVYFASKLCTSKTALASLKLFNLAVNLSQDIWEWRRMKRVTMSFYWPHFALCTPQCLEPLPFFSVESWS